MTTKHGRFVALLAVIFLAGCHGLHHRKSRNSDVIIGEPGLGSSSSGSIPAGADDPTMVPGDPPRKVAWYDRHPLTRKPMEVYQNTGKGPVVKTAAATFVGVPWGIGGEVVQIFRGCPPGF